MCCIQLLNESFSVKTENSNVRIVCADRHTYRHKHARTHTHKRQLAAHARRGLITTPTSLSHVRVLRARHGYGSRGYIYGRRVHPYPTGTRPVDCLLAPPTLILI